MRWVPSHTGNIAGNDAVDKEAKRAAKDPTDDKNNNFGILKEGLLTMKVAWKQKLKQDVLTDYSHHFRKQPRYDKISRIDPSTPSNKFQKLTRKLMRAQVSLLIQLHTGHVPLNSYLYCFKLTDSPLCIECDTAEAESVLHVLKFCHKYANQ